MAQRLIPGIGFIDETGSAQRLIPGAGYVNETVSTGVSGTSATTNTADTTAASGTTTVTGTSAKTNANDAATAAGATAVTGTSGTNNASDTPSASGATTVIGTSTTTNASDVSAASGGVGSGATGSSATANANDSASAAGTTTILGAGACVNASDNCASSGTGPVQTAFGGGFYEVPHIPRHRTVQEERERLGIIPKAVKKVLVQVAQASVSKEATDTQATGLLATALAQRDIQPASQYTQFMQQERDRILSQNIEMALRIRQRQYELDEDEREAEMLLM